MNNLILGLEVMLSEQANLFRGARVGLICNPATVDHKLNHAADLFRAHPDIELIALFGPQHGIRGETQDNMIEWQSFRESRTGVMAYSLYGEMREPNAEMLKDVDVLVFDVQDVGTRVYTFIYTMALAMNAACKYGKRFVVLDRPNPIGGVEVEGNILDAGAESFVGMYPIPMRHGMTIAELAQLFNQEFEIGCELSVIPMKGYRREFYFADTDLQWVIPSPNIPTPETAIVYPGNVFVEGTKISEGRGTTKPFEINGAPYADSNVVADYLNDIGLPGVRFRPHSFKPTFQKYSGHLCHGVQIHVLDRNVFRPVITGIALIKAFHDLYPDDFQWQVTPYEYVYDRLPFDVIAGGDQVRKQIEDGVSVEEISRSWQKGEQDFIGRREKYLLY